MSIFPGMTEPWPWYVAGPLIGLVVPLLLLLAGREFGVSSSLQHICAACVPHRAEYFRYDWRRTGLWNLAFVAGANRCGTDPKLNYNGSSLIANEHGAVLGDAGDGQKVISAEVDANAIRQWRKDFPALADMRTE